MKIGDFPVVEALVDSRSQLGNLIGDSHVTIEIGGRRMGADFAEAIRPAVNLELRNRIVDINHQLRELGVQVD